MMSHSTSFCVMTLCGARVKWGNRRVNKRQHWVPKTNRDSPEHPLCGQRAIYIFSKFYFEQTSVQDDTIERVS